MLLLLGRVLTTLRLFDCFEIWNVFYINLGLWSSELNFHRDHHTNTLLITIIYTSCWFCFCVFTRLLDYLWIVRQQHHRFLLRESFMLLLRYSWWIQIILTSVDMLSFIKILDFYNFGVAGWVIVIYVVECWHLPIECLPRGILSATTSCNCILLERLI